MLSLDKTISAAEAAFLANLAEEDVCYLSDGSVLPHALCTSDGGRRFAPLASPFAAFYFSTSETLTSAARIYAIATLTERLLHRPDSDLFLTLSTRLKYAELDWTVHMGAVTVTLSTFAHRSQELAGKMSQAARHIEERPGVLAGVPCFRHTRVPIANVLAAVTDGVPFEELQTAYPFLTHSLLAHAETYARTHPDAGKSNRLRDLVPNAALMRSKTVPPAQTKN